MGRILTRLQLQLEEMGDEISIPFHSFTNYSMNIFYKSLTVVWIALLLYGVTMIVVSIPWKNGIFGALFVCGIGYLSVRFWLMKYWRNGAIGKTSDRKLMKILYETNQLQLVSEFENAFIVDKATGTILAEDDFYGDASCGIIAEDNSWVIIAGQHLSFWKENKFVRISELQEIHSLRYKDPNTVEILIDPWSEQSSVWEINIRTLEYKKVREFKDYSGKEYTEDVMW